MYVYKKQCDEQYYLNIIQFIDQLYQKNIFQYQFQNNYYQDFQGIYNIPNPPNYFHNFNNINNDYNYQTPKRKKQLQIYKYFNDSDDLSSSYPKINFTNNEKFVLNKITNIDLFDKELMNYNYEKNANGFINKKIFKLEDFFTDKK